VVKAATNPTAGLNRLLNFDEVFLFMHTMSASVGGSGVLSCHVPPATTAPLDYLPRVLLSRDWPPLQPSPLAAFVPRALARGVSVAKSPKRAPPPGLFAHGPSLAQVGGQGPPKSKLEAPSTGSKRTSRRPLPLPKKTATWREPHPKNS